MSVIWGIPYLFIRIAVTEITPATMVLWRTAIAAAILLPIALARTDLRPVLARWRWVVAFAAVEIAIPWVALGSAEQHISSSMAGLLIAGVPLVGAAIALATGGADRFGAVGLLGMLIGIAGVALIVGADLRRHEHDRAHPGRHRGRRVCARAGHPGAAARWPPDRRHHGGIADPGGHPVRSDRRQRNGRPRRRRPTC